MSRFIDLTGQRFGRLVAVERVEGKNNHTRWLCKCDCGKEIIAHKTSLDSGRTKSCGCLRSAVSRAKATKHGQAGSRIYNIWANIKTRCYNKNALRFKDYGSRGITMCDEWKNDFQTFYDWAMASGYREDLTIDRIDSDGNYEPSNCRWSTQTEQQNNKRGNVVVLYQGEEHTIAEWAKIKNIPYHTLRNRITSLGWSVERAMTEREGDFHNRK